MEEQDHHQSSLPPIIINNNLAKQPSPPRDIKIPRISLNLKFPEDSLSFFVAFVLFVLTFHPNSFNWLRQTEFGKFVAIPTEQKSKPAKVTATAPSSTGTGKKFLPMPGLTKKNLRRHVRSWVGECRPYKKNPCGRSHAGIDIAKLGPVISVLDGEIIELKFHKIGGIVGVKSSYKGKQYLIRYVHLNKKHLNKFRRKSGEPSVKLKAGQMISVIDSEAFPGSSGPHLHIEIYEFRRGIPILSQSPQNFWDDLP